MKRAALACLLLGMPLASAASAQDVIFRDGFELVCPADMGDCDGNPADCETALDTLTDCGGCDVACNLANASETCNAGQCTLGTCSPGFDNCDGNVPNGCERSLNTLRDCGGCNVACNLANASETCNAGQCALGTCSPGFGNCDGDVPNGCEQPLTTLTHCGACNQQCDLANASETCANHTCQLASCDAGFSNCDGSSGNGCEVQLGGHSNSPPGYDLGAHDADSQAGLFCPGQGCDLLLSQTGRRGRFFTITANEDSDICAGYVSLRFELVVPAGVDYDLYVTGGGFSCEPSVCRSTFGSGVTESVVAYRNDTSLDDDSFTATIEVRHFGGTACGNWTLNVYRRECR